MKPAKPGREAWKLAYKIFTWVTLAGLVLTILLILHKSPAPAVAYDPAAASRVEQKFAAAGQQTAAGQPAQVALDSTELNSYLQQNLQFEGSPQPGAAPASEGAAASPSPTAQEPSVEQVQSTVKDVKVEMDGDLIKAYVIFDAHGADLSLELEGRLGADDGYMKFQPVEGKIGSFPLPQSALDTAVERLMSSPENRDKLKLPDDVNDIRVENGQVVVSYK